MAAADRISEAEGQRAGFDDEVALRDLREECLCEYIKAAWPIIEPVTRYLHNWHIDAIAEHLEAVTNGEIRRRIITFAPLYEIDLCVGHVAHMGVGAAQHAACALDVLLPRGRPLHQAQRRPAHGDELAVVPRMLGLPL